jgi:sarcosine oxidase
MARDAEVIVVGAGVMGLATARALGREGRAVLLLEQFELNHDRGSSHGTSRIFRFSYPEEPWVRLAQEALPLWRELEAEAGQPLLEQTGSLDFGDWEANRRALAATGAELEVLDAAEIEARFPSVAAGGETALFQPDGGFVHAAQAQSALAAASAVAGVRLLEGTRAERLEAAGDGVRVRTADGAFDADAVVVTAGAWAASLLAPLGLEPPVVTTRETVTYYALEHDGPVPSVINLAGGRHARYALAAPGVGLKAGLHMTGPPTDPDETGVPDEQVAAETATWVARQFHGATPLGRAETCLYSTTDDERFLLERHGRVVVGSACSGHGFKFAPAVGRRLAALAAEALAD